MSIDLFRNVQDIRSFSAGEPIFQKGESGDLMYGVVEGQVNILIHDKLIETVQPGGILGEMALIDHKPRSATAVAKTDCKLAPVDQKRFEFLVQQTPYFAIQVMSIMADRLRAWGKVLG